MNSFSQENQNTRGYKGCWMSRRALTRVGTDSLVRGTPVLRSARESIGKTGNISVPPTRNGRSLFCPRVRDLTAVCIY